MQKVLIIGGSGFLSGTIAREAAREGCDVWAVTRGQRPLPADVRAIVADRKDARAFGEAIRTANTSWDLVIDCIGYTEDDARQDVATFTRDRAGHLVFISTDFVYSPVDRPWRVDETYDRFETTAAYGRQKREAEEVLLAASTSGGNLPPITILRPCHIYGPGSQLGCLPKHGRDPELIKRLKNREALQLVGGGHFLQQPVFAKDLWAMCRSCVGNARTAGQIYHAPGPDIAESRTYYQIIADTLGVPLIVREASIVEHLREHPDHHLFCAHRVYSTEKGQAHALSLPTTPLREGLLQHVEWLCAQR